jgi:hypothetical protein
MSVEDPAARTSIRGHFLLEGVLRVGLQHDKYSGGAAAFADSLVSRDRVEWEAVSFRSQGTIDITLTSVKKAAGQEGYEIHGTFEAVMPYTNLPVGNPTPDVTLRISF